MHARGARASLVAGCVAFAGLSACVPTEPSNNPAPGSIEFVVSGSEWTKGEIPASAFADGWSFRFERVLVSIGPFWFTSERDALDDEGCTSISRRNKSRVLDLAQAYTVPINGLRPDRCDRFQFSLSPLWEDSEPGPGASLADVARMREEPQTIVELRGVASRAIDGQVRTRTLDLRIPFGLLPIDISDCVLFENGQQIQGVRVVSGVRQTVALTFRVERVFREALVSDSALLSGEREPSLRFDPFALADEDARFGNADGVITFDELDRVPLDALASTGAYDGRTLASRTLAAFVAAQFRTMVKYAIGDRSGYCAETVVR